MKEQLRSELLKVRNALPSEDIKTKSASILSTLSSHPSFIKASTIMYYASINSEVQTLDAIKQFQKTTILPKIIHSKIVPVKIDSYNDLILGSFDILEPCSNQPFPTENIDIILVPGLGFDRKGNRIGYGKGYYDDFLKECKALKIGLSFSDQIVSKIPTDEWDQPLDLVITEKEIITHHQQ